MAADPLTDATAQDEAGVRFTFGPYSGIPLAKVPASYLRWTAQKQAYGHGPFAEELRRAVESELERRYGRRED